MLSPFGNTLPNCRLKAISASKVAKSSISEVLPIEDKTSSVNFVDSFPEGEAKKGKPLDEAIKKPSPWGEGAERKRSE